MLAWITNLGYGAGPVEQVVVEAVIDEGRDSGGGAPEWWEGEWRNPPRERIRARLARPPRIKAEITPEQRVKLDATIQSQAELALLGRDLVKMEKAIEAVGPALKEAKSRRAKQRLYNQRSSLRRQKRAMTDEISVLEKQAVAAARELEGLEWLAFLQAEDEQFMRIILELI